MDVRRGRSAWKTGDDSKSSTTTACAESKGVTVAIGFTVQFSANVYIFQPCQFLLLQRRLRWFGRAAQRAPGEFMRELINPDVPRTWRRRTGGQLKTWATTLKEGLVRLIGPAVVGIRRWDEWASLAMDLARDRRA